MDFTKEYLTDIVKGKAKGDFSPFSSGQWEEVDVYLKRVVGRLKDIRSLTLKAEFDHYGSGFSSYVHLYVSKRDKSDVKITLNGKLRTEETNGLMIYLCRLAPYAVFAEGYWSTTYNQEEWDSGSSHYIESSEVGTLPNSDWQTQLIEIKNRLNEASITVLTKEELDRKLDFDIQIPTILSDPPYQVFDCFFHWTD